MTTVVKIPTVPSVTGLIFTHILCDSHIVASVISMLTMFVIPRNKRISYIEQGAAIKKYIILYVQTKILYQAILIIANL